MIFFSGCSKNETLQQSSDQKVDLEMQKAIDAEKRDQEIMLEYEKEMEKLKETNNTTENIEIEP